MKLKMFLVFVLIFILFPSVGYAEDYYFVYTPGGQGDYFDVRNNYIVLYQKVCSQKSQKVVKGALSKGCNYYWEGAGKTTGFYDVLSYNRYDGCNRVSGAGGDSLGLNPATCGPDVPQKVEMIDFSNINDVYDLLAENSCGKLNCFYYLKKYYCDDWKNEEKICKDLSVFDVKEEYVQEDIVGDRTKIVDCEQLLGTNTDEGQKLVQLIKWMVRIIFILVPIILLTVTIVDFSKAVFSGEDGMKKAQGKFFKRILIAVLIFLIPILIKLILTIGNLVWPDIISPDLCGIL